MRTSAQADVFLRGFGNDRVAQERLRAQELALVLHLLVATLVLTPAFSFWLQDRVGSRPNKDLSRISLLPNELEGLPGKLVQLARGGGSGGEGNPIPATKGKLPPFAWIQLTPPMPPRNPDPILIAEATLLGPPDMPLPSVPLSNFGIPNAPGLTDSAGPGHSGGFGNKCCGGAGNDGDGRGYGPGEQWGTGGPGTPGRGGVGYPECQYCPEPRYTDTARKAKYQGTVTLLVVITPDGRATNIRVVKGLGMGLDENAVAAVRDWKFKPALAAGGRAVAVELPIEVNFRLF